MREIKFKVWHKEDQRMFWFDLMWGRSGGNGSGWLDVVPFGTDNRIAVSPDDCEIMQYTGLKDKNGKEIFEGDIIRKIPAEWISKSESDERSIDEYLLSIANIGLVEYSVSEFILTNKKYRDKIYDGYGHGSIEVIGNIYENPELLTA